MPGVTQRPASVLDRLDDRLTATADTARDTAMTAYMRDQFSFAGVPAPALRALTREVLAGLPSPDEDDLRAVATGAWQRPQREYQYFACAYLRKHLAVPSPAFLADARTLITTKPWWDTVDALATRVVGGLVRRWALRQHARTDPDAVRAFLADNRTRLSPLTLREAAKHL